MAYTLEERKCGYCGKIFVPAPYHSYKHYDGSREIIFCCYTCNLKYDREEKEKGRRKYAKRGL